MTATIYLSVDGRAITVNDVTEVKEVPMSIVNDRGPAQAFPMLVLLHGEREIAKFRIDQIAGYQLSPH